MKKETAIDLAKFEEAKETIRSIQAQFSEILLDEIEKNPVFECKSMCYSERPIRRYVTARNISGLHVIFCFTVYVAKEQPDFSSDFQFMDLQFTCESLEIFHLPVHLRKSLAFTLHFTDNGKDMLLQYKASGGN